MAQPTFSIVIPTRQRHRTLAAAIPSVLLQDYSNFEVIVQDNCSSEETAQVVRQFASPRLKYQRTPYVLPMNENWEQGLDLCQGEWIFFLGDDDALMPDGLRLAASILERMPLEVLMWDKYTYWWEDALEPSLAGRMFLHLGHNFQMLDTGALLRGHYDWTVGMGALPSVYTGFVRRSLIDRVKAKAGGKYFAVGAPDHFTGIANAYLAESAGKFERGLSLSGNSGQSTGCSYFFRSRGAKRRQEYHAEERKTIAEIVHPRLIPSPNLEVALADVQLRAKEVLFPEDSRYDVPMRRVVEEMAANINRDPASYDETLSDVRAMAVKHSVDLTALSLPQRVVGTPAFLQGLMTNPQGQPHMLAVNCSQAGVHEAASAARLASALLPTLTVH